MAKTSTERRREHDARHRAAGRIRVCVWVDPRLADWLRDQVDEIEAARAEGLPPVTLPIPALPKGPPK